MATYEQMRYEQMGKDAERNRLADDRAVGLADGMLRKGAEDQRLAEAARAERMNEQALAFGAGREDGASEAIGAMQGLGDLNAMAGGQRAVAAPVVDQANPETVGTVMQMLQGGMDAGYVKGALDSGQITKADYDEIMRLSGGQTAGSDGVVGEPVNTELTDGAAAFAMSTPSQNQPSRGPVKIPGGLGQ